jgi:hypothetical protein
MPQSVQPVSRPRFEPVTKLKYCVLNMILKSFDISTFFFFQTDDFKSILCHIDFEISLQ